MNHYLSGIRALERRDFDAARCAFSQALAIDPRDSDALALRGCVAFEQGDDAAAAADGEAAIALNRRLPRAYYLRALIAESQQRSDEALAELAQARSFDEEGLLDEMSAWGIRGSEALRAAAPPVVIPRGIESNDKPVEEIFDEPVDEILDEPVVVRRTAADDSLTLRIKAIETPRVSLRSVVRAGFASALVHAAGAVALGLLVAGTLNIDDTVPNLLASIAEPLPEVPLVVEVPPIVVPEEHAPIEAVPAPAAAMLMALRVEPVDVRPTKGPSIEPRPEMAEVRAGATTTEEGTPEPTPISELAFGRAEEAKKVAVIQRGGTPATEAAVTRALAWLARHQNEDGSWNFNHQFCPQCQGQCKDPGMLVQARIGATAMALLPFLGAGHTHRTDVFGKSSDYQSTVSRGLKFLLRNMQGGLMDGAMTEPAGRMYDHGLALTAVSEAYGMTQDRHLLAPAQRAVRFTVSAQDPIGGGWRYLPRQAGDTSAVAWQVMGLKSAYLSYIKVPDTAATGAFRFLNYVQLDGGARYGYTNPGRVTDGTTAAGLLCRMYLGWKHDEPALVRGVEYLDRVGPSAGDMYYNYYATQVMHHYEGPMWAAWNRKMRDDLLDTQAKGQHLDGSWYFAGDKHGAKTGGRLYSTSLAALTLEVYYRYMPLYTKRAAEGGLGQQ